MIKSMSLIHSIHSMKKLNFQPSLLQVAYLIIYLVLFSIIIYIPTLISGPLQITKKLIFEEETIEGSLLGILFLLSIWILNLYKYEVTKNKRLLEKINDEKKTVEERLDVSDRYIGVLNIQLQEIKAVFNTVNKYPESKEELKKTFRFFGERILGIVNSNWVLIRIINSSTQRTISEHFGKRQGFSSGYPHVSNKMIIEEPSTLPYTSVISCPQNINIIVFCVMPQNKISNEQHVFIQAIINEITKLFLILNSSYYKKESKLSVIEKQAKQSVHEKY